MALAGGKAAAPVYARLATKEAAMAKGQMKSNKEMKKPKAKPAKVIAAKPSTKGTLKAPE